MKYKQCENCGNYFLVTPENQNKNYCSADCEKKFIRCIVCGNYYELEEGMDEENYICCASMPTR